MLRLITALAVGGALFAGVIASAAQLTINGGTLQAGVATVGSCDTDGVVASYTLAFTGGQFGVSAVTISGINSACSGKTMSIYLMDSAGATLGQAQATLPATGFTGSETFAISPAASAAALTGLAVDIHD